MSTHWVKRPMEGAGLDHLGVQAVSFSIYQQLLPGLTNVTERIACYSFYPWFVWAFDQESPKKNAEAFVQAFRRAECLVGLVAAQHGIEEDNTSAHGVGLAGNFRLEPTARAVIEGKAVRLSTFATTDESEDRYFKNRLGGLGQYYLGPLRDLFVLDGDANSGVGYTDQKGVRLATALDAQVDRSRFFQVLRSDRVDRADLVSLSEFCPCRLKKNDAERKTLKTLLFNVSGSEFHIAEHAARAETLRLMLDYCGNVPVEGLAGGFAELAHRIPVGAYAGINSDGSPWHPVMELEGVRRRWAAYQRHELLSVALQNLFWAGLTELSESDASLPDSAAYGRWMSERLTSRGEHAFWRTTVADALREAREHLPPLVAFGNPDHELELARAMMADPADEKAARTELVMRCLRLLLAVEARSSAAASYADVFFPADYFASYELNLLSLRWMMKGQWAALSLKEWLRWLACHWGIRAHTRIALRKLRYDSRDTFRVIPTDQGLRVIEPPLPGWTSPRLRQAARALFDLRLIKDTGCLTVEGARVGEFCGRGA